MTYTKAFCCLSSVIPFLIAIATSSARADSTDPNTPPSDHCKIVLDQLVLTTENPELTQKALDKHIEDLCKKYEKLKPGQQINVVIVQTPTEKAAHIVGVSLKALGSPLSGTSNTEAAIDLTSNLDEKSTWETKASAGLETALAADQSYKHYQQSDLTSKLDSYFGGSKGESFTVFASATLSENDKKLIQYQINTVGGIGRVIVGDSYRENYTLKASVGLGYQVTSRFDANQQELPIERAPIVSTRLKSHVTFFETDEGLLRKVESTIDGSHVVSLNEYENFQSSGTLALKFLLRGGYQLGASYELDYDNSTADKNKKIQDKLSIDLEKSFNFGPIFRKAKK